MNVKLFLKPALLALLFCEMGTRLAAQPVDSLLSILDKEYPQEKIYIHYDRPYYNTGETIWFKAYLFSANLPSAISNTLYAELIDEKGEVLQRKTMPVFSASASGDFVLPDTMRSSLVYVRAYTPWMLNFDSSFLYVKPIRIIASPAVPEKIKKENPVSLHFFPEGGDLVVGLESRIAFKATDDQGFPVAIKGDIINSKKEKIISFADIHDGMGYFVLRPAVGEQYKAVWKDKKGVSHETFLPAARKEGVILGVVNSGNNITYSISRTEGIPATERAFQVIAQMQQMPVYIARVNLTARNTISAPIPSENLPDGIMQITIFANNKALAERIVFVNNHNFYFITDLHTGEKNFSKKARNTIQIDVGDTLVSNLSISVTDASATTSVRDEENIFSHVLLSSDIKGYVHNPAYYFSGTADSLQAHLDLVMMTHGWRRFKWDDVLAQRWPVIKNYPYPYITVNGNILGLLPGDLVNKELTMIVETKKNDGGGQFISVPVTPKGEFIISNMIFYDTAKLYYQFNNDKEKRLTSTASFNFRNNFIQLPQKPVTNLLPTLKPVIPDSSALKKNETLARLRREEFVEGVKVKELEAVVITARQKTAGQKLDEEYTSGFFSGGDGYTFAVEDDPLARSSMSVFQYLQGKVAGLQISPSGPGGVSLSWRGGTPSLFMNEMNADISLIQSTPMSDVALIKVFRPPFLGAIGGGAGGAIAIYTKKGSNANSNVKGLDFTSVVGYSPVREFYSPDYSSPAADKNKNDYRATLYWNPYVVFDKYNRRLIVPFYNNDNCKRIRVVIEGINQDGKLTREEKYFE